MRGSEERFARCGEIHFFYGSFSTGRTDLDWRCGLNFWNMAFRSGILQETNSVALQNRALTPDRFHHLWYQKIISRSKAWAKTNPPFGIRAIIISESSAGPFISTGSSHVFPVDEPWFILFGISIKIRIYPLKDSCFIFW